MLTRLFILVQSAAGNAHLPKPLAHGNGFAEHETLEHLTPLVVIARRS